MATKIQCITGLDDLPDARVVIMCYLGRRDRDEAGRGPTARNEWVKMDLEYIDHWSLWLDFKILARTAWVVLAGTGK